MTTAKTPEGLPVVLAQGVARSAFVDGGGNPQSEGAYLALQLNPDGSLAVSQPAPFPSADDPFGDFDFVQNWHGQAQLPDGNNLVLVGDLFSLPRWARGIAVTFDRFEWGLGAGPVDIELGSWNGYEFAGIPGFPVLRWAAGAYPALLSAAGISQVSQVVIYPGQEYVPALPGTLIQTINMALSGRYKFRLKFNGFWSGGTILRNVATRVRFLP